MSIDIPQETFKGGSEKKAAPRIRILSLLASYKKELLLVVAAMAIASPSFLDKPIRNLGNASADWDGLKLERFHKEDIPEMPGWSLSIRGEMPIDPRKPQAGASPVVIVGFIGDEKDEDGNAIVIPIGRLAETTGTLPTFVVEELDMNEMKVIERFAAKNNGAPVPIPELVRQLLTEGKLGPKEVSSVMQHVISEKEKYNARTSINNNEITE